MNINSERAKAIDGYLATHPDAEVGKWPLEIAGQKSILPFYRFPIEELLCYNVNNGRLAMDVREWQKGHGRKLDSTTKEDTATIRKMLLDLDKSETERLRKDLRRKNQMEPGVITQDGFVINGNRRMAIFEELHADEPTGKWLFLEAVRLPETIGEKDLWKIEAGLQLSKGKIAEYHPVNELLKIKQGTDASLSIDEIAAAMYGRTVEEIKEALDRLGLIDMFLEFFKQPANYDVIRKFGLHEYFIDIQKHVIPSFERLGLNNRQRKGALISTFSLIAAHIRNLSPGAGGKRDKGITHWDIRKLGKIFADLDASEAYTQNLVKWDKNPLSIDANTLIEDFRTAEDILGMKEQRDQPVRLIEKAIKALESIDKSSKHFSEPRVKQAMGKLLTKVQEINAILET